MATLVMNTGRVPLQVGLILDDGTKTDTRIMARGRAHIEPGSRVDPNWLAQYGTAIRVIEEKPPIDTTAETPATPAVAAPTTPAPVASTAQPEVKPAAATVPVTAKEGTQ